MMKVVMTMVVTLVKMVVVGCDEGGDDYMVVILVKMVVEGCDEGGDDYGGCGVDEDGGGSGW